MNYGTENEPIGVGRSLLPMAGIINLVRLYGNLKEIDWAGHSNTLMAYTCFEFAIPLTSILAGVHFRSLIAGLSVFALERVVAGMIIRSVDQSRLE